MHSMICAFSDSAARLKPIGRSHWRVAGVFALWILCSFFAAACGRTQGLHSSTAIARKATPSLTPLHTASTVERSPATVTTTPTLKLTAVCSQRYGSIEQGFYLSPVLRQEVPYLAYLPPCYASSRRHYPSLYLLHGYPFNESQWIELDVVGMVDDGIAAGRWPSVLMVMPRLPEPLFTSTDGGSGSYETEMIKGLIPAIEGRYRTDPRASRRALVGISRGGVWALEIGLRHGELFEAIAALSPALHVNHSRPAFDPYLLAKADQMSTLRIFLSAGEAEPGFLDAAQKFAEVLEEQDIVHELVISSAGHDEAGWLVVLDSMLSYLLDPWNMKN